MFGLKCEGLRQLCREIILSFLPVFCMFEGNGGGGSRGERVIEKGAKGLIAFCLSC